jgi:nicotinic acid phosphoribosyltransferase
MIMLRIDEDFKHHILQNYPLSHRDLEMLLDDLGEFFKRDYREYIRDRHLQLQKQNMKNDEIYRMIQGELPRLRFSAPELSTRQIRRIIYG